MSVRREPTRSCGDRHASRARPGWVVVLGLLAFGSVAGTAGAISVLDYYADLASSYPWEEQATPTSGAIAAPIT